MRKLDAILGRYAGRGACTDGDAGWMRDRLVELVAACEGIFNTDKMSYEQWCLMYKLSQALAKAREEGI